MNMEDRRILEIVSGSNLYGTTSPTSDKDYIGICVGLPEHYFGLSSLEEIDLSTISKGKDGKNDADAVDRKLYEIRKFVKLALDNNPNTLEVLMVNETNVVYCNTDGRTLLDMAHLFPWKGAKQKFLGYAFGQRHKMQVRTENIGDLRNAYEWLENEVRNTPNKLLAEIRNLCPSIKDKGENFSVGDLNFYPGRKLKDVSRMIKSRLDKATNRSGLMEKYGYDTKFGSHLLRLMLEGKEILQTGRIQFPLKEAPFLIDVKNGKYTMEQVLKWSYEFEEDIVTLEKESKLPSSPRYKEIELMLMGIVKEWMK